MEYFLIIAVLVAAVAALAMYAGRTPGRPDPVTEHLRRNEGLRRQLAANAKPFDESATDPLGEQWYAAAKRQRQALVTRYRQTVTKDSYGGIETGRWKRELDQFRRSQRLHVPRDLRQRFEKEMTDQVIVWSYLQDLLDEDCEGPGQPNLVDPHGFERWCRDVLRSGGWEASTTKASGDQGVDIVASREGATVAIQCKLYGRPVGNNAVQEVHAAAGYVDAQHAVVVSNADFTPAARQLAGKLGVHLVHHTQLNDLWTIVAAAGSTRDARAAKAR